MIFPIYRVIYPIYIRLIVVCMRRISLNMFYFRKRRLPLADALQLLHGSIEIVQRYIAHPHHVPDDEDHILLIRIINEAQDLRLAAMQAYHGLEMRAGRKGETSPQ